MDPDRNSGVSTEGPVEMERYEDRCLPVGGRGCGMKRGEEEVNTDERGVRVDVMERAAALRQQSSSGTQKPTQKREARPSSYPPSPLPPHYHLYMLGGRHVPLDQG